MPPVTGPWVRQLKPIRPVDVVPVCEAATLEHARAQVGGAPVEWAIQIGHEMAVRALELTPEFGTGDDALATLRLGTEYAAVRTLVGIDAGDLVEPAVSVESDSMMREYVHRRVPLEKVWGSIRYGHAWFAEYYTDGCRSIVPIAEQADQLALISRVLFEFVNAFAAGVGEVYHEEEQRWLTSAAAARDETVRAVLAGDERDGRAAGRNLRYDVEHRHHLALILCQERTGAVDTTALHQLATRTLTELGASQTFLMPVGRTELWAWGGSATAFRDIEGTASATDLDGVRGVLGNPGWGLTGFRSSHLEAQEAARVVLLRCDDEAGLTTFPSVSLLAMLTANPALARSFIRHELGGLTADDPQTDSLRETLLAYLESRRSPQTAAARLFVAKNTVVYRVKRAEELLGRSLDDRPLELWTALLLARTLGPCSETAPAGGDHTGTRPIPSRSHGSHTLAPVTPILAHRA